MVPTNAEVARDARSVLLACLDAGLTGALEGEAPLVGPVAAYVMMGEIVAARAEEDDDTALRILVNRGRLDGAQALALREALDQGSSLTTELSQILPDNEIATLLFERFRENLYQFLRIPGEPAFIEMDTVFVENIQVGHDARALVAELVAVRDEVASLETETARVLVPGAGTITDDEHVTLLALCNPRATLSDVLGRAPMERSRALVQLRRMLDTGVLAFESSARRLPVRRPTPSRAAEPTAVEVELAPSPLSYPAPDGEPDEHTEEVPRTPSRLSTPSRRAPPPEDDDFDDLAAFGDYDRQRAEGSFVADRSLLDTVDLEGLRLPADRPGVVGEASTEVLVETAEADASALAASTIRITFTPPRLADEEASHKIEVVGEVLATVVAALDEAHGPGVGRARVQVLLEGTSGVYATVFAHVELEPGGWLPTDRILRNLRKRPAAEQRQLLNTAMADVVERALTLASSALDEDRLDRMLEKIAGFQARFGV